MREGDDVRSGRVLIRLDPTQFQAVLSRARAALSQARAQSSQQEATLLRAERDYERLSSLSGRDSALVSRQQLQDAATNVQVARASLEAARHFVEQARASVAEADDRLAKTVLRAPIDGRITRLQVEEGETVIIGTMNTPGSLILTISDLSVMEVVVQVDETDVPRLAFGDSASVAIDAFPEETLTGRVTEIGNSALRPPSSQAATGEQAAIDFEVVLTLEQPPVPLRPDLSATADIVVDARDRVVAVPDHRTHSPSCRRHASWRQGSRASPCSRLWPESQRTGCRAGDRKSRGGRGRGRVSHECAQGKVCAGLGGHRRGRVLRGALRSCPGGHGSGRTLHHDSRATQR